MYVPKHRTLILSHYSSHVNHTLPPRHATTNGIYVTLGPTIGNNTESKNIFDTVVDPTLNLTDMHAILNLRLRYVYNHPPLVPKLHGNMG